MKIGKLRKKIDIMKPLETADSYGDQVKNWTYVAVNRWAEVNPKSGRESFLRQQTIDEKAVTFGIRYLEGITPKMKVVYGNVDFNIQSIVNVDERNRELQLECTRVST